MRHLLASVTALLAVATASSAGETAWQELLPGVKARLISAGAPDASGRVLAGLEIDLPIGMKTYWRVPGETGLPPRLDLEGSRGIAGHDLHWPYPSIDRQQGYLDFVYTGRVVMPLDVALSSDAAELDLSVFVGICSDICIPADARFNLALSADEAPDRANGLRLRQALAHVPQAAPGLIGARYDAATNELVLDLPPGVDTASIIVACADGDAVFGAVAQTAPAGQVRVPLLGRRDREGQHTLEILYRTIEGGFRDEITLDLS